MTLHLTTLPNGLRVLTDTVTSVESVALGAYFGVGTRHEDMAQNGIAHLVEHMMFKGTPTRTAQDIALGIESIGGHMNAYTSREVTGYHFHLLKDHVGLGVDVLADMLQNATIDPVELERERQVIIQEIGMENDSPDDLVFDHYQATAYPGQTLGAPVLGTADIVAAMPRAAIQAYVRQHYTPGNMVISAAGNVSHDDFVALVKKFFTHLPPDTAVPPAPARFVGGDHRTEKDLEQAHVLLGFEGLKRSDPRYYSAVTLAHILGGGMSSRLFQEIREKRGLAYNVYAFHASHADSGQFAVYAGTGPDRLDEYMTALCTELKTIAASVTEDEVARTRTQLKANLLMGREGMVTRADQNAKYLLFHGRVLDTDHLRTQIDAVTLDTVRALAAQFFVGTPVMAAMGPIKKLPSYDTVRAYLR
jgi:predicted Zn-dependent peptidase